MTAPTERAASVLRCTRCGAVLDVCGFCERDACNDPICFRCVRLQTKESMAHPHVHGG